MASIASHAAYSLDDAFTESFPLGPHRYSSRGGADVRLGIVHTAEGSRTNKSLANFFNNGGVKASSHASVDDSGLARLVPEIYSAWTASKANPVATQIEICGFARWSVTEWLQHAVMLEYLARWMAAVSVYHDIPLVRVRASQVRTGRGFCMHHDITIGWPTGSHTDCGAAFRDVIFDRCLERARQIVAAGTHDLTEEFFMALDHDAQVRLAQQTQDLWTSLGPGGDVSRVLGETHGRAGAAETLAREAVGLLKGLGKSVSAVTTAVAGAGGAGFNSAIKGFEHLKFPLATPIFNTSARAHRTEGKVDALARDVRTQGERLDLLLDRLAPPAEDVEVIEGPSGAGR